MRKANDGTPKRVTIKDNEGNELANVAQRDLFSKYGWPAQDEIVSALEAFKAKRESLMQEPIGSEA